MNVAIIGCGLIGGKRAGAIGSNDKLVACCDTNAALAESFAEKFGCKAYTDCSQMIAVEKIDIAVVAVVNKFILPIVVELLEQGINVIAEKPLGRNSEESAQMLKAVKRPSQLKTGFNHRFHPAVFEAKRICDSGAIGKIFSIRARYGHGGRAGMEKEWRASKELCGGGELLDQGVHCIDLIRWFGGDVSEVYGKVSTKFWEMEVEDNAFAVLETKNSVTASFHVSWTNWKNIFSFEVFGSGGYVRIEGLGGSYGTETLEMGIRKKEGGRPDITFTEFPPEDISWDCEWKEFLDAIQAEREPVGSGNDGHEANKIIQALYTASGTNTPVRIG